MHKKAKILFFCMIFVAKIAEGQNFSYKPLQNNNIFTSQINYRGNVKINISKAFNKKINSSLVLDKNYIRPAFLSNPVSSPVIAADYYTQCFGFFCKKELQFEKTTKIPLSFRLGSLQYNNYLEGKPNAGILPSY